MATSTSKPTPVGNNIYKTTVTTNADGSLKTTTFRTDAKGSTETPVFSRTTTPKEGGGFTNKDTLESGATAAEKAAFSKSDSPERKAFKDQVQSLSPTNANASQKEAYNSASGASNQATTQPTSGDGNGDGAPTVNPDQAAALEGENKEYRANTRAGEGAYGDDLKYPLDLEAKLQDTVRFSILEYSPSLAKENQSQGGNSGQFGSQKTRLVTLQSSGVPIVKGSKRLGTITLPIPAGISDGNSVSWNSDDLTQLQQAAAEVAQGFFTGNTEQAVEKQAEKAKSGAGSGDLQAAVMGMFMGAAAQNRSITARAFGAVGNNNTELLFSGPGLRTFGFTFSFYPRSAPEAVVVRKIIRAFKQSMSVKRSKTSLLLKAPHTFAISYFTSVDGQLVQHPYLNSFKECALTSCSVDYTPDGTYMTYGDKEKSMTAYRLTLQFQELEPIFDDEYYEIDQNKDTNIGF